MFWISEGVCGYSETHNRLDFLSHTSFFFFLFFSLLRIFNFRFHVRVYVYDHYDCCFCVSLL